MTQFPQSPINSVGDCITVVWKCLCDDISEAKSAEFTNEEDAFKKEVGSDEEGDSNHSGDASFTDVPHTVVFKCIGASRDSQSQRILRAARDVIAGGGTVSVRMRPEPTNIFDSRAIVFECESENKWKKIGYVVT